MPVAQSPPVPAQSPAVPQVTVLPSLFGEGCGVYKTRPGAFVASYAANVLITVLFIWSGHWFVEHRQEIKRQVVGLVTDVSPYILSPSATQAGGGGGGGDSDKLAASKGSPPKFAREQITPPVVVVRNENPKRIADPTVVGPPQIQLPNWAQPVIRFPAFWGRLPVAPVLEAGSVVAAAVAWALDVAQAWARAPGVASEVVSTAWAEASAHLGPFTHPIRNTQTKLAKPSIRAQSCYGWWWGQMAARATYTSRARWAWGSMKRHWKLCAPGASSLPAKTANPFQSRSMWK